MKNNSWVVYGLRLRDSEEYRYIGKTTKDINSRMYLHFWESSKDKPRLPVHKWIRSVGKEKIEVDILHQVLEKDNEKLNKLEIEEIKKFKDFNHRLLNLTEGGEGTLGYRGTSKSRKLQSERMSGINNPRYGTKWTPELRDKIIASLPDQSGKNNPRFGKKNSDEHRRKISENHHDVSGENNPFYGKSHTEETKKKMSEAWQKRSPEEIQEINKKRKEKMSLKSLEEIEQIKLKMKKPKKSNHTRYHTNKGIFNNNCKYCLEGNKND